MTCNNSEEIYLPSPELSCDHEPPELSRSTDEESRYGDINQEPEEEDEPEDCLDDSKRRKLGAALYSIHLQERHFLTNSAVELVRERTTSLLRWSLLHVKDKVLHTLRNSGLDIDSQVPMLEEIFDSEINPFEGVNSTWLNEQFIKENFPYVVSINYIFILDRYK